MASGGVDVAINTELLGQLASLHQRTGDAVVTVQAGVARRILHVAHGCLVAADSTLNSERLGDVLVGDGRVDPGLLEPLAAEARRQGRLLGDQLIADGLLTPADLAAGLERQVLLRFEHAVTMMGQVTTGPKVAISTIVRQPLGALVVRVFRERLPVEEVETFVANRSRAVPSVSLGSEAQAALALMPAELRICRRLVARESLRAIMTETTSPEPVLRLVGALVALGLWS